MAWRGFCSVGGWWVTVMFPRQRANGKGQRGREGKMVAWDVTFPTAKRQQKGKASFST
jgi:hypothetical protein